MKKKCGIQNVTAICQIGRKRNPKISFLIDGSSSLLPYSLLYTPNAVIKLSRLISRLSASSDEEIKMTHHSYPGKLASSAIALYASSSAFTILTIPSCHSSSSSISLLAPFTKKSITFHILKKSQIDASCVYFFAFLYSHVESFFIRSLYSFPRGLKVIWSVAVSYLLTFPIASIILLSGSSGIALKFLYPK